MPTRAPQPRDLPLRPHVFAALATLLALGFSVRWLLLMSLPELWTFDSRSFLRIADRIVRDFSFAEPQLGILRLPGYPVFLALVRGLGDGSAASLLLAQAAIGLATVASAFAVGLQLCRGLTGACALGLFAALNPAYLVAEHAVMSESLALALLLAATATVLACARRGSGIAAFPAAGAALAASLLTRLNSALFLAALGALLLWALLRSPASETRRAPESLRLVAASIPAVLLIAPWIHRNDAFLDFPTIYASGRKQALVYAIQFGLIDPATISETSTRSPEDLERDPGLSTFWALLDRYGPRDSEREAARLLRAASRSKPREFAAARRDSGARFLGIRAGDRSTDFGAWLDSLENPDERLRNQREVGQRFLRPTDMSANPATTRRLSVGLDHYSGRARPLLAILLIAGLLVAAWRWFLGIATVDWILLVLTGGYIGTVLLHAWMLGAYERFAVPLDWIPLAIFLRAIAPRLVRDGCSALLDLARPARPQTAAAAEPAGNQ